MTNNRSSFPARQNTKQPVGCFASSVQAPAPCVAPWPRAYDQTSRASRTGIVSGAVRTTRPDRSPLASEDRYPRQRSTGTVRLVLIATLAFLAVFAVRATKAGADSGPRPVRTVVVRDGDTLWTIARTVQPEGDVRPLVSKIARSNNLRGVLQSGTTLVLPN